MVHYNTPVDFYFDFLSPYSYLAWTWLRETSIKINPIPVVLAQVIHHYETKGPAEIAPKRDYLWKHCLREAAHQNILFQMPRKLPFNSSFALRLAIASDGDRSVIDKLFRFAWEFGGDLEDTETLLKELNLEHLDQAASSRDIRKQLKLNVEKAIQHHVFGVPTFVVADELFWGYDAKRDLEAYLRGEDKLDRKAFLLFSDRFARE